MAIGITNQRETTVVWDKTTGKPVYNAHRLAGHPHAGNRRPPGRQLTGVERFKATTGLPLSTYFAGTKIVWILENVPGARERAERGELLFGTTDSWVLWNLTGGIDGGVHATDVTNASRTLLMSLETLQWDDDLLSDVRHPAVDAARDPQLVRDLRLRGVLVACCARCRLRASSATSRRRRSGRRPSTPARRRTRTAPATS